MPSVYQTIFNFWPFCSFLRLHDANGSMNCIWMNWKFLRTKEWPDIRQIFNSVLVYTHWVDLTDYLCLCLHTLRSRQCYFIECMFCTVAKFSEIIFFMKQLTCLCSHILIADCTDIVLKRVNCSFLEGWYDILEKNACPSLFVAYKFEIQKTILPFLLVCEHFPCLVPSFLLEHGTEKTAGSAYFPPSCPRRL